MLGLVNRPNDISLSRANQSQAQVKSVVGGTLLQSWVNLTIVIRLAIIMIIIITEIAAAAAETAAVVVVVVVVVAVVVVVVLQSELKHEITNVKSVAYADDYVGAGSLQGLKK